VSMVAVMFVVLIRIVMWIVKKLNERDSLSE
jgi:hypothetical protein